MEAKYDGQRGLAGVSEGAVSLWSRNGANITHTFPEITAALAQVVAGRPAVLDGEIVALDQHGAPSFSRLRRRWPQNRRPTQQLLRDVPVRFYVSDVLAADSHRLTHVPYVERRTVLTAMTKDAHPTVVRIPPCWTDIDPRMVLDASAELGLEGIVCKHLDSPYLPGRCGVSGRMPCLHRVVDVDPQFHRIYPHRGQRAPSGSQASVAGRGRDLVDELLVKAWGAPQPAVGHHLLHGIYECGNRHGGGTVQGVLCGWQRCGGLGESAGNSTTFGFIGERLVCRVMPRRGVRVDPTFYSPPGPPPCVFAGMPEVD